MPPAFAADADRIARFEREARTLAALTHPHIAQICQLEQSDGARALVMELVPGEDLAQQLARGLLPTAEAIAVARPVADALDATHAAGIIHRVLKPANIKVRADGVVKVLDLGLAKAMDWSVGNGVSAARGYVVHRRVALVIHRVDVRAQLLDQVLPRRHHPGRRATLWVSPAKPSP